MQSTAIIWYIMFPEQIKGIPRVLWIKDFLHRVHKIPLSVHFESTPPPLPPHHLH